MQRKLVKIPGPCSGDSDLASELECESFVSPKFPPDSDTARVGPCSQDVELCNMFTLGLLACF